MYPQQNTVKQSIKNAKKMGNRKPSAGERLLEKAYALLAQGRKKK